jgi:hypothetical protein
MNFQNIPQLGDDRHHPTNAANSGAILFPPVLFISPFLLGVAFQYLWPVHFWTAGTGYILASCALVISGAATLERTRRRNRPAPKTRRTPSGIWTVLRWIECNLDLLANTGLYAALSLGLSLFWPLITLTPFCLLLHWGVRREDETPTRTTVTPPYRTQNASQRH